MRMVEQLSAKETAASLGIREETVRTRLHRAKKLMREQLQTTLASALTDTFLFQDPRAREKTIRVRSLYPTILIPFSTRLLMGYFNL
jgi:hypothetical protein